MSQTRSQSNSLQRDVGMWRVGRTNHAMQEALANIFQLPDAPSPGSLCLTRRHASGIEEIEHIPTNLPTARLSVILSLHGPRQAIPGLTFSALLEKKTDVMLRVLMLGTKPMKLCLALLPMHFWQLAFF